MERRNQKSVQMDRHWLDWGENVLSFVRFKPDHPAIWKELVAHMEDNCADFQRVGYEPEEAARRALEAMGSAQEVGQALNRAHKPWLGWLWRISKWMIVLCAVLLAWTLIFGEAVESGISKTKAQMEMTEPPARAEKLWVGDYTVWYDPVLQTEEFEDGYGILIEFWIEADYPWTGRPVWMRFRLEGEDSNGSFTEDTEMYIPQAKEGWTRYHYLYGVQREECPEWMELRYPYGAGLTVRAEREVAE